MSGRLREIARQAVEVTGETTLEAARGIGGDAACLVFRLGKEDRSAF